MKDTRRRACEALVVIIWFFGMVAAFVFGMAVGHGAERKSLEREAVKAGRARWVASPDGEATFEWCECVCRSQP